MTELVSNLLFIACFMGLHHLYSGQVTSVYSKWPVLVIIIVNIVYTAAVASECHHKYVSYNLRTLGPELMYNVDLAIAIVFIYSYLAVPLISPGLHATLLLATACPTANSSKTSSSQ